MHIWRPFVLWFGARTPAFFRSKKRSFGFHGLQGYVYHTLTNCIAQISNCWFLPMIPPQCKGNYFHSEILLSSSSWYWAYPSGRVATVARTLHPLRRSPERYSPLWKGRAYKTEWVGLPRHLPPIWSGFYMYHVLVSWFVIGKSSNLLFFGESSHSWYRWKTLEKTFWKLSTWNESLVRKNMSQTKWLLLVSTNFNQW